MPTDPATVPTLTDADIEREWDEVDELPEFAHISGSLYGTVNRVGVYRFARRIAALVSADTAVVERRAARKALTECAKLARTYSSGLASGPEIEYFSDRYLAREYPAPAPRECVLSDKSVVTRNPSASKFAFTRNYPFGGVVRYRSEDDWRLLADTGADFDALKRFAAEVGQ